MKSRTFNAEKMGLSNKRILLNLIRTRPGISRRELSEITGLDPSTVTKIIQKLTRLGLVKESGVKRNDLPGRNSIALCVEKKAAIAVVAGVGLEKTHFSLAYFDHSVQPVEEWDTPHDFDAFMDRFAQSLGSILEKVRTPGPFGLCLSVPGMVDRNRAWIEHVPHFGWKGIDFPGELKKRFCKWEAPIFLANEAKLSLLAEMNGNPALQGFSNGAYFFIGQGIGGALLIDGKIFLGPSFSAGEIGHMNILESGPACHCGNSGCLESVASVENVVGAFEKHVHALRPATSSNREKFERLLDLSLGGEENALHSLERMRFYFALAITSLVNTLNLEFIVLGGMGEKLPDFWLESLERDVRKKALPSASSVFRILRARYDIDTSPLVGGTLMVMENFAASISFREGA